MDVQAVCTAFAQWQDGSGCTRKAKCQDWEIQVKLRCSASIYQCWQLYVCVVLQHWKFIRNNLAWTLLGCLSVRCKATCLYNIQHIQVPLQNRGNLHRSKRLKPTDLSRYESLPPLPLRRRKRKQSEPACGTVSWQKHAHASTWGFTLAWRTAWQVLPYFSSEQRMSGQFIFRFRFSASARIATAVLKQGDVVCKNWQKKKYLYIYIWSPETLGNVPWTYRNIK